MKKIVFFNRSLMSGGIEKCLETLMPYLNKEYEIEIVYSHDDKLDPHIVEILSKYAKITHLQENVIKCDVCVFCYMYFNYEQIMSQIIAKDYWAWVHSKPRELENCLLDNHNYVQKVSKFICVSNEIKKSLNIEKEGIVIHNFINQNIQELANTENPFQNSNEEELKLVIVSRLSNGKGFERVVRLVEALERKNIPYSLKIIGKGRQKEQEIRQWLEKYERVKFEGYQDNPYCYVKNADYLVLLSDYESWGNVITEAKVLGTPCLITDFPAAKEQIENGKNGIIVSRQLENYDDVIEELIEKKKELTSSLEGFHYYNEFEKWKDLLNRQQEQEDEVER